MERSDEGQAQAQRLDAHRAADAGERGTPSAVPPRRGERTRAKWGRYGRKPMLLLASVGLIDALDRGVLAGVLTQVQAELGANDFQMGLLDSAYVIAGLLFALPAGYLSDRRRRNRLIAATLGLWTVLTAVTAAVRGYGQMFAVRAAVGFGDTMNDPACQSLLADYYPPRVRSRAYAYFRAAPTVGRALGMAVGGGVGALLGWRAAFLVVALPGLIIAYKIRRLREPRRGESDRMEEPGADTSTSPTPGLEQPPRAGVDEGVSPVFADAAPSVEEPVPVAGRATGARPLGPEILLGVSVAALTILGFGLGHALGQALGIGDVGLVGGLIAAWLSWRNRSHLRDLLSPLSRHAPSMTATAKTPEKPPGLSPEPSAEADHRPQNSVWKDLAELHRIRSLRALVLGTAVGGGSLSGLGFWAVAYHERHSDMSAAVAGGILGVLILVGSLTGTIVGGHLADRLREKFAGAPMVGAGGGYAIGITLLTISFIEGIPVYGLRLPLQIVAVALLVGALPGIFAMISEVVPARLRGTGFSLVKVAGTLLSTLSPPLIGWVSDQFVYVTPTGREVGHLGFGFLVFVPLILTGAALLLSGWRHVEGDRQRAQEEMHAR